MEIYPPGAVPTPGTGKQYYFHADGEGSIRLVTDSNGQTVDSYSYDSYGNRTATVETVPQLYGWKGRELIPGVNLYYNRARFYDPVLGRFTSEDPLGFAAGDTNLYDFAWDNPHNWNDPSGMDATGEGALTSILLPSAPALARTGKAIACVFNILANALQLGPGASTLTVDHQGCTVIPTYAPIPPPPPPLPPCKPKVCPRQHNSFEGDTLVATKKGLRPIKTIAIGDLVLAKDAFTGKNLYRPVTDLFRHTVPFIDRVTLQAPDGTRETTGVTPDHRIFVAGRGWTQVRQLRPGDHVLTDHKAEMLKVVSVEHVSGATLVYNLGIGADHSYFVGTQGAWVHNRSGAGLYSVLRACSLALQFFSGKPMDDPGDFPDPPAITVPYQRPKILKCRRR